ncbi:MAG: hypothetical protein RXQ02_05965 [Thermoproteus sp.]
MRPWLPLLLLSALALAASVQIQVVDGSTGRLLNGSMVMVWQGGELVYVGYGSPTLDLAPGTYLVEIYAFNAWFNQTISVPGVNPIRIVIPTALLYARAWDMAAGKYADSWTVEILGPDNATLAAGRGVAEAEVVATGAQYRAAAVTPYGVLYGDWTTPQPGQNLTLVVQVPTAFLQLEAYDVALGKPANFTVRISGNGVEAYGVGAVRRELLAGRYDVSVVANLSGGVFSYDTTVSLEPGENRSEVLRVPTAVLYLYAQTPTGSPIPNATILLYGGGRLLVNATGPSVAAEVLGGQTYTAVARYRNMTATADVAVEPGARLPVYLNLSAAVGTTIRVTPQPATSTSASSAATSTASATAGPRTAAAKATTAAPAATTTAAAPRPPPAASSLWALFMTAAGALALALALALLALVAMAGRRSKASEDLGPPEVVEAA